MRNRKGIEVQERLMKFFRGWESDCGAVDFETRNVLWEVKSARLFHPVTNSNHKRPYKKRPHKISESTQYGRFAITTNNHIRLYLHSLQTLKVPKYIFVIRVRNQIIWRIVPWEEVRIANDRDKHLIPIREFFADYCVEEP